MSAQKPHVEEGLRLANFLQALAMSGRLRMSDASEVAAAGLIFAELARELQRLWRVEEAAKRLPKPLHNGNHAMVSDSVLQAIDAALADPAAKEAT